VTQMISPAAFLASLPESERTRHLEKLSDETKAYLKWHWPFWARPTQLAPAGDWLYWLYIAGRGSGKTRAGAEWIRDQVRQGKGRIHLIAPTAADARDVMVEGESGLLAVCYSGDTTYKGVPIGAPLYEPSKRQLTWKNGAIAKLFSAEEPERLRGPQCDGMWADELAAWNRMQDTWDMAMFGLRLGDRPRAMVTTTPKPMPLVRELMKDEDAVITRGSTFENQANLAPSFLKKIRTKYEGTRLGRQELYAELLEDIPGALWTWGMIDSARMAPDEFPDMRRVVVAVDPSGTNGDPESGSDDIGIVIAGEGIDGRFYVIEDATCNLSPDGWGRRAVERFQVYQADRIVAERNFGGAMVESVIRAHAPNVPVRMVSASRGKAVRAEPISALYEQGRVSHPDDECAALEDQMLHMTISGYIGEGSPDRLDAAVWALSELALEEGPATVRAKKVKGF